MTLPFPYGIVGDGDPSPHAESPAIAPPEPVELDGRCVHERVAEWARRTPHAPAVSCGGERLTYAELDARANRLAHRLRREGVGREARVGVLLERGVETVVAILAALKAGGAYLPLDPAYPAERLEYTLADAGAAVLITERRLMAGAGRIPPATRVVLLDAEAAVVAAEDAGPPESGASPGNLAYVIYTSGSTGRPKGVGVTHANVDLLFAAGQAAGFAFAAADVWTVFHSFSFDFSVWEMWGALLFGGHCIVVPRALARSPDAFLELLCRERVTVLSQATSALVGLTAADSVASAGVGRLSLRLMVFGGERLHPSVLRGWVERHGDERPVLVNLYGITETTVLTTWRRITAPDTLRGDVSPIGAALPGYAAYLLDGALEPVGDGRTGEICVGGRGIARGYLGRPGLTAERFVPDPFAGTPGARMYRSGDLARRGPDGGLESLGRTDHQVKVRGFRVELGEVEAAVKRCAGVRHAAVVARADPAGSHSLAAYAAGDGLSADALRAELRAALPEHMVPAAVVVMDALPLTPNGKVDHRALPDPRATAEADWKPPETPTEQALAAAWGEILGLERVSALDTFFGLGGHSLQATRMAFGARKALGIAIPVATAFEPWTLRELARWIDERRAEASADGPPPLERAPRGGPLPVSLLQEYHWFQQRLDPGLTGSNLPFALRLRGPLDAAALERALTEVVRRHEALRTTFAAPDGVPVQVIGEPAPRRIPRTDLTYLPEERRNDEALRLAHAEARRPFDLARGPLMRMRLLRLDAEEWALLATLHHIVCDGWSLDLLVRELGACYDAYVGGMEPALAGPEAQAADHAAWQRGWLRGDVLARHAGYWRETLAGARPLDLAGQGAGEPRAGMRRVSTFTVPAATLAGLNRLGVREGATLFMVTLAAFKALLARYTGQPDVTLVSPLAGRSHPELADTIGFFAQMALLRTDLSGDPTFREALRRVRRTVLGAYGHQELPLFERLGPRVARETAGYAALRRLSFALREVGGEQLALRGLEVGPLGRRPAAADALENVTLLLGADHLTGVFNYRVDVFPAERVKEATDHYVALLAQVAADPDLRLSAIDLSPSGEQRPVRRPAAVVAR